MQNLDPTYLRYIYDGLIKGSVHPENTSELPDGLIGLYEEAFEEHLPVLQRQQLLQRFALFALLKKEVSAAFVAEVLGESEIEFREFILNYASWFNSPEPGKFQLYHERLKVYVFQKFSEKEIHVLHEKFISRLELAIEEQKADEFDYYALEFLSEHLAVEAFGDENNGKKLLNFTKNETLWDRQIRISNKFDWSRKGLHQAALWTSKHDQEENIDCYLDLVQLHIKEQNDAENIVRLVANNEMDLALERISAFGGPSKEEKERQFILFFICLMELTLFNRKDKPINKEGIVKLIDHINYDIPVYSINWSNFIPSHLFFLVSLKIQFIGINIKILFERTQEIEIGWLNNNNITLKESIFIIESCNYILNKNCRILAIIDVLSKLLEINQINLNSKYIERTLNESFAINEKSVKSIAFIKFAVIFFKKGRLKEYEFFKEKALNDTLIFNISSDKNIEEHVRLLIEISRNFHLIKKNEEALTILNNAIEISENIEIKGVKSSILSELYFEIFMQGQDSFVFDLIFHQENLVKSDLCILLFKISTRYFIIGNTLKLEELKSQAFSLLYELKDELKINLASSEISLELSRQGNIDDALKLANSISMDLIKNQALNNISLDLCKHGDLELALKVTQLSWVNFKSQFTLFEILLKQLSSNLNFKSVLFEILSFSSKIDYDRTRFNCLHDIALTYCENNKINSAFFVSDFITSERKRSQVIKDIIIYCCRKKKLNIALENRSKIKEKWSLNEANAEIILLHLSQGLLDDAKSTIILLNENYFLGKSLLALSNWYFQNEEFSTSKQYILHVTKLALEEPRKADGVALFEIIALEYLKRGDIDEALKISTQIVEPVYQDKILLAIIDHLCILDKFQNIFPLINSIHLISNKALALKGIALAFMKKNILNEQYKLTLLSFILVLDIRMVSNEIKAINNFVQALYILQDFEQAIELVENLSNEAHKKNIWTDLGKLPANKKLLFDFQTYLKKRDLSEALLHYRKGLASSFKVSNSTIENIHAFFPIVKNDKSSLLTVLQMHVLNCLFFQENYAKEKIDQFNKVLNIQWAIDLKNELDQLPN